MSRLKRFLVAPTLSAALILFAAAQALASPPEHQPLAEFPDIIAPMCGASMGMILAQQSATRAHETIHFDHDGSVRDAAQGYQEFTVTALATGKALSFNGSGPGTFTFYADGNVTLDLQGHTVWLNLPDGGIFIFDGLVVWDVEHGRPGTVHGHVTDVCALLS